MVSSGVKWRCSYNMSDRVSIFGTGKYFLNMASLTYEDGSRQGHANVGTPSHVRIYALDVKFTHTNT